MVAAGRRGACVTTGWRPRTTWPIRSPPRPATRPIGSGTRGPSWPGSPLGGRSQERLDVEDRGAVEGFQVAHMHPVALDRQDVHGVQADRVRPVRGAGGEDAGERT